MRRLATAAALVAIAAALLAGCSAQGSGSSKAPAGPAPLPAQQAPGKAVAGDAKSAANGFATADRSVVTTGNLTVTVDDPIAASGRAVGIAEGAGGRVDDRSETPSGDGRPAHATLVLRIPADKLDAVLGDLRRLGHVDELSLNAADVTLQKQDLDGRIGALRTSVARLTELLAKAQTTADLIAIETELTNRQAELDSLTQQRDVLADQIAYSTLTLDLASRSEPLRAAPGDFWGGLVAGWTALVAFLGGALVVVGVALPWLLFLAVVGAVVAAIVLVSRRGGRRSPSEESGA